MTKELRQIVIQCMQKLDTRHRAILTMRCYDRLSYAQIAEHLSCTEFGARALFYRAKKSLAKHLSAHGLGRGSCVMALVLFGKITAPTKAAAAGIQVTEATLSVGSAATLAGFLTGKAALLTLSAGLLTTGAVTISPIFSANKDNPAAMSPEVSAMSRQSTIWYYFPEGQNGPLMLRTHDASGQWQALQNAEGNYIRRGNRVYIRNQRDLFTDLRQSPRDNKALTDDVPGRSGWAEGMPRVSGRGLLIVQEGNVGQHDGLSP